MRKYRIKQHRGLRQPVYGDGKMKRIISAPNDTWIAQEKIGESDWPKWENIGRATTKAEAMRQIGMRYGDQT